MAQRAILNSQTFESVACPLDQRSSVLRTLRALHGKREYIFGSTTLLLLLLLESRWNAPVTRHENLASVISSTTAAVNTGEVARKILGLILGISGLVWISRFSAHQIQVRGVRSWLVSAWVVWLACTFLWSDDPGLTTRRLGLFLMLFLSALAMGSLKSSRVFALLTAMSVVSLVSGVACELYWGAFHPFAEGYRFGGAAHPNLQGTILAVGVIAAIGLAVTSPQHRRIAALAGIVCTGGLVLTNSRSAIAALIIACVLGMLLWVLRGTNWTRRAHVVICFLCFAMAAGLTIITVQNSSQVLLHSVAEHRDDGMTGSFNDRTAVWATCMGYASKRPFLGYGYDSFWTPERISAISTQLGWLINEAHSSYLDEVLNTGLIGTVLFLVMALSVLGVASNRYLMGMNEYYAWVIVLLFMFVHSAMESLMMPIISLPAYAVVVAACRLSLFDRIEHELPLSSRGGSSYEALEQ